MPRQQNETTCECEALITYTATPTSSDDRGKYVQIEDMRRECDSFCVATDAAVLEMLELEASEPYDERED